MNTVRVMVDKVALFLLSLAFVFAAGMGTGIADEYDCDSSGDKCNISQSGFSASAYCMKKGENWQCSIAPLQGTTKCTAGSTTKQIRPFNPAQICTQLCGSCNSGWNHYQGGGSTF